MKLCDHNNTHPLNGDLGMYLRHCYVTKGGQIMYVLEVNLADEEGDPTILSNITFYGDVHGPSGPIDRRTWSGDEVCVDVPLPGYRMFHSGPEYISYSTENRTTKKGIDPRRVIGMPSSSPENYYLMIFGKNLGEIYVHMEHIYWRGRPVGFLRDGKVTMSANQTHMEDFICQKLGL